VQVDPIKSTLKAPGTKRLNLRFDDVVSSFAFNPNLRRYDLGLHAFVKVLSRKQARHSAALALLGAELRTPVMRAAARRLAPVVDPNLSNVFNEIRF